MRTLFALTTYLFLIFFVSSAYTAEISDRFCVSPVVNGAPGPEDDGATWRMVSKTVMLPGVPYPVIYALNRGGVWTINDAHEFARFGGDFPANMYHDKFVQDPLTGAIFGINSFAGVFLYDPNEGGFQRLAPTRRTDPNAALWLPAFIDYVPRYDSFVIASGNGLHELDREGNLSPLRGNNTRDLGQVFRFFDLPELGALLISRPGDALLRWDEGGFEHIANFDRRDEVTAVEVSPDGSTLEITTWDDVEIVATVVQESRRNYVPLPGAARESFIIEDTRRTPRLRATAAELILVPLQGPVDQTRSSIRLPASRVVLVMTMTSMFAIDERGTVSEVDGGRGVANGSAPFFVGVIPERNEALIVGPDSLYLAIDREISGDAACAG